MAKGDKFYFENFKETTALALDAAKYLVECLENYTPESIEENLQKMHEIENNADKKKHEMNEALAKAFVTPVDREDLAMLSQNLDQVPDSIEEVLQKFYIFNIKGVPFSAIDFAKKLVVSTEILCELMAEFENFKRSKKIKELIVKLNDVEEECDKIYLTSLHDITGNHEDAFTAVALYKIFDCFEACADACEHVGDSIGTVIMKNT